MKRLTRHLPFYVAAIATALGTTAALSAWATTNCYNYSNSGTCATDNSCSVFSVTNGWYCKQLTNPPYTDAGCCAYYQTITVWSSVNNGTCPCAGAPTTDITSASNTPLAQCQKISGGNAPDNTDVKGNCVGTLPP